MGPTDLVSNSSTSSIFSSSSIILISIFDLKITRGSGAILHPQHKHGGDSHRGQRQWSKSLCGGFLFLSGLRSWFAFILEVIDMGGGGVFLIIPGDGTKDPEQHPHGLPTHRAPQHHGPRHRLLQALLLRGHHHRQPYCHACAHDYVSRSISSVFIMLTLDLTGSSTYQCRCQRRPT